MLNFYSASNATHTISSGWRVEPPQRGTYSILSTCLFTIGLSVWTALHLNIPAYKKVKWQGLRKLKWLIVGLFAPEVVAWTAFCQHGAASKLYKKMRKKLKMDQYGPRTKKTWTMTHSHYVLMGGLAIVPAESQSSSELRFKQFTQGYFDRLTITLDGVAFLADQEVNLLKNISEDDIKDKSKANGLTKALVCLQAFWFCLQCVARLKQGLKISLLELNTFAHALNGLNATDHSITMHGKWLRADVEITPKIFFEGDITGASMKAPWNGGANLVLGQQLHGFCISGFSIPEYGDYPTVATNRQAENPRSDPIYLQLKGGQVRCLELASQAIDRYGIKTWDFEHTDGILAANIPDWPKLSPFNAAHAKESLGFLIGFTIAGILYGGLHLSAWNAPFPTNTQRIMWRISGIVLISTGPGLAVRLLGGILGEKYYERIFCSYYGCIECFGCLSVAMPWFLVVGAAYILYGLARVYLVLECFITLFHLPDEVYLVPKWTQYIPHII